MLAEVGVRFPLSRGARHPRGARRRGRPRCARSRACRGRWSRRPWPRRRASSCSAAATRACDLPLDGRHCYLSNDASGVFVIDPASGERRPSTLADVAASARFVDALPEVAFYWGPIVAAGDAPVGSRALHEAAAVLANTTKHFQAVTCVGEGPARLLVEMARAVAGGADELRRRPLVSLIACPVDPLGNDAVSLEAALVCAAAGVPCGVLSLTLGCGTAPASLAGNLVVNAAAVLADLVLLELAQPRRAGVLRRRAQRHGPAQPAATPAAVPKTTCWPPPPPSSATRSACRSTWGPWRPAPRSPAGRRPSTTPSRRPSSVLAGADMMSGCGLLDGSRTLSYPHLVMETEVYRIVQRLAEGIVVDEETLALDAIRRVGPQRHLPGRAAHAPPRAARSGARPCGTARRTTPGWPAAAEGRSTPPASWRPRSSPATARAAARRGARRAGGHRGAGRRGAAGLRRQSGDAWARGTCCVMQWIARRGR